MEKTFRTLQNAIRNGKPGNQKWLEAKVKIQVAICNLALSQGSIEIQSSVRMALAAFKSENGSHDTQAAKMAIGCKLAQFYVKAQADEISLDDYRINHSWLLPVLQTVDTPKFHKQLQALFADYEISPELVWKG